MGQKQMQFRNITRDDLREVSELGVRSKATWGYSDEVMAVFTEELTHDVELIDKNLEAIVACVEEKIVGYFTLVRRKDDSIELDFMFVRVESMLNGVGTAMMHEAVRLARSHGAEHLWLIADPNADGFYEKFGAKQTSEYQSSIPGRTIPVMRIDL